MSHDPNCIFCKIIAGDIPSFKLYEDDDILAFMDINPFQPGHCLVIPKQHVADIYTISDAAISAASAVAARLARAVRAVVEPDGLNIIQANGPAAGQSVFHFHFHVFPRAAGDNAALNWGMVPGDMAAIEALAGSIRTALEETG